jgi:hypothetical protein
MAAFALIGMATQLAYWQHFHLPPEERLDPDELAQACAGLFLEGAGSQMSKGGKHATGQ